MSSLAAASTIPVTNAAKPENSRNSFSILVAMVTDTERDMVAEAIVEHIKLCNWKVERGAPWGGCRPASERRF